MHLVWRFVQTLRAFFLDVDRVLARAMDLSYGNQQSPASDDDDDDAVAAALFEQQAPLSLRERARLRAKQRQRLAALGEDDGPTLSALRTKAVPARYSIRAFVQSLLASSSSSSAAALPVYLAIDATLREVSLLLPTSASDPEEDEHFLVALEHATLMRNSSPLPADSPVALVVSGLTVIAHAQAKQPPQPSLQQKKAHQQQPAIVTVALPLLKLPRASATAVLNPLTENSSHHQHGHDLAATELPALAVAVELGQCFAVLSSLQLLMIARTIERNFKDNASADFASLLDFMPKLRPRRAPQLVQPQPAAAASGDRKSVV